jgi:uncharacterized protein YndB with AHSA1/START domain
VIDQQYYFEAPVGDVFNALTEPEELVKWFLGSARIRPVERTNYTFTWKGGSEHTGEVLKVVPNRNLVLSWPNKIKGRLYPTQVSFTLVRRGKGTLLKLKHTGFKDGDDWVWLFGAVQSGWTYFLMNLKSVIEQGRDLRSKYDSP